MRSLCSAEGDFLLGKSYLQNSIALILQTLFIVVHPLGYQGSPKEQPHHQRSPDNYYLEGKLPHKIPIWDL